MHEYLLILVSTILVNNFVLVKFLGLCPFMGVSKKMDTAIGMGFATTFVLTLASVTSYLINTYLLIPFELEYLRTIAFIVTIAAVVGFTELVVNKTSPVLHQSLGVFLPLITTNCAVLGVALLNGVVLSVLIFVYNYVFQDSLHLAYTVSLALFCVILVAALFGTFVPLVLDKYEIDPALATGPFITTVNDVLGLFIYFLIGHMLYIS